MQWVACNKRKNWTKMLYKRIHDTKNNNLKIAPFGSTKNIIYYHLQIVDVQNDQPLPLYK